MAADVYLRYDGDWGRYLASHPGAIDQIVGMAPGTLSALGLPTTQAGLTALLAKAYSDGAPTVTGMCLDGSQTTPPRNLKDLLDELNHRNDTSAVDPEGRPVGPNIDVRKVTGPDNKVCYIVDIPGTKIWNLPGDDKGSANDLGANLNAMAGNPTVLEKGVKDALSQAHVGPHDPVMLVGHSQGGIVAARTANDFVTSGQYNVTHVVTAGSPIGRIPIPDTDRCCHWKTAATSCPTSTPATTPPPPTEPR